VERTDGEALNVRGRSIGPSSAVDAGRAGRAGTLIAVIVMGIAGTSMLFYAKSVVQRAQAPKAHSKVAAANEPTTAQGWYQRAGELLKNANDIRGASKAYRKAAELAPEMGEAHYGIGFTLLQLGDTDGAIAELESALSLAHPGSTWKTDAENALVLAHLEKAKSK
jgi:Flp pilus assembly protein TadD